MFCLQSIYKQIQTGSSSIACQFVAKNNGETWEQFFSEDERRSYLKTSLSQISKHGLKTLQDLVLNNTQGLICCKTQNLNDINISETPSTFSEILCVCVYIYKKF